MPSVVNILLLLFIRYALAENESEITKAMLLHSVIPDVIDEGPKDALRITFDNGALVDNGAELTPTQVQNQPSVEWQSEPGAFYTLLFIEPDAPSRTDFLLREWQHWLIVNIPGNNVSKGTTLSEYQGSGPGKNSGLHRYVYLLFKQPRELQFDEQHLSATSTEGRPNFSTKKFIEKYDLGKPVAGNFYECQYDEYSDVLLDKLGF